MWIVNHNIIFNSVHKLGAKSPQVKMQKWSEKHFHIYWTSSKLHRK